MLAKESMQITAALLSNVGLVHSTVAPTCRQTPATSFGPGLAVGLKGNELAPARATKIPFGVDRVPSPSKEYGTDSPHDTETPPSTLG